VKAVRVHEYHSEPRIDDIPEPKLQGPLDVIVKIGGAGVCRTDDEGEPHRRMVVGRFCGSGLRASSQKHLFTHGAQNGRAGLRHGRSPGFSGQRLRLSPAAGDSRAGHSACTWIAEIRSLCAPPGVVERDAHDRAFSLLDFRAALVTDEHRLSSHISSNRGNHRGDFHRIDAIELASSIRPAFVRLPVGLPGRHPV